MKKLILSVVLLLVALFALGACSFTVCDVYPDADKYAVGNASFSPTVTAVDLRWSAGAVEIVAGDGNALTLTESAGENVPADARVHYYLDGSTLRIRYAASGYRGAFDARDKKLTLTLPASLSLDDISVTSASAPVSITGTTARDLAVSCASGDATVSCRVTHAAVFSSASGAVTATLTGGGDVAISTASGDVTLDTRDAVGEIGVDTASGRASVTIVSAAKLGVDTASGDVAIHGAPDSLDVETASGKVDLWLPESADFAATFDTASGSFHSDLPLVIKGNVYVSGVGTHPWRIDTASGDLTIHRA